MRLKFIKEFSFLTKATIRKLKLSKLYTTYLKIDKLNIHTYDGQRGQTFENAMGLTVSPTTIFFLNGRNVCW